MTDNVNEPQEQDSAESEKPSSDGITPVSTEEMGVDDQLDEVDTISVAEQRELRTEVIQPEAYTEVDDSSIEQTEVIEPAPIESTPTAVIEPEPPVLPYVPADSAPVDNSLAVTGDSEDEDKGPEKEKTPRGTIDFGLFLMRVAVALVFALDGADKLFGLLGGSIGQTEEIFRTVGFTHSTQMWAIITGSVELVAGIILLLGLFTPFAASALLGVAGTLILTEIAVGIPAANSIFHSSLAFLIVIVCALSAVILAGAGRWAIDGAWKWATLPKWGSLAWWVVGIVAGPIFWAIANTQGFPF